MKQRFKKCTGFFRKDGAMIYVKGISLSFKQLPAAMAWGKESKKKEGVEPIVLVRLKNKSVVCIVLKGIRHNSRFSTNFSYDLEYWSPRGEKVSEIDQYGTLFVSY